MPGRVNDCAAASAVVLKPQVPCLPAAQLAITTLLIRCGRERHLEVGRRAISAGERDRVRSGLDADVATGEPGDPAGEALRPHLDDGPAPGRDG